MATTIGKYLPLAADFPSSSFAALGVDQSKRAFVAFDATTAESCSWTDVAPQGLSGNLSAVISYRMVSGTSGGVAFDVAIEAISSGDALNTISASSYAAGSGGSDASVPGTAGYMEQLSISISDTDSLTAADYFRLGLSRDVADAADTATGDCHVLAVELRTDA